MRSAGCLLSQGTLPEAVIPLKPSLPKSFRVPQTLPIQDQGSSPMCVAYSMWELLHYYGRSRNRKPQVTIQEIFDSRVDKKAPGMQPIEAFKFLKGKEVIRSFGRVTSESFIRSALITNGPLMVCLPVYNDIREFWRGVGSPSGYHAVAAIGYTPEGIVLKNSWGPMWGDRGTALLPDYDFSKIRELWTILT